MNILHACVALIAISGFAEERPQNLDVEHIGVGAEPLEGTQTIIDGTRKTVDEKWTCWAGPRFGSSLPIKWKDLDLKALTTDYLPDGEH